MWLRTPPVFGPPHHNIPVLSILDQLTTPLHSLGSRPRIHGALLLPCLMNGDACCFGLNAIVVPLKRGRGWRNCNVVGCFVQVETQHGGMPFSGQRWALIPRPSASALQAPMHRRREKPRVGGGVRGGAFP